MSIDHEDDENFDQRLELQLGKMVSPSVGFYGEVFLGDDVLDSNAYGTCQPVLYSHFLDNIYFT